MVKKEVDHFPCIGEDREDLESWGGAGVFPNGVEAGEETAAAEGLTAEAGGKFPLLGTVGEAGAGRLRFSVDELGDVLEGSDKLVNAISLCQEDHQLVQCVIGQVELGIKVCKFVSAC